MCKRPDEIEGEDLQMSDVEEAVLEMKNGKAPGVDDITVEMIKAAGHFGIWWLYRIMRTVCTYGEIPDDWTKAIIVSIFKKGNKALCENYRGIALLCHCMKIYEKIILQKIRNKIESQLREEQQGFRPGRSTIDAIFTARQVVDKKWEFGKDVVVAFINIQKAYDTVRREEIWQGLNRLELSKVMQFRIRNMYNKCLNCVVIDGKRSGWFGTDRGVRQGSVLSPVLFNIVMDSIIRKVRQE